MGGGAWPFLVGGVICLVNSVNERDLSLLNSTALFLGSRLLRGTMSVMPLDVRAHARYTDGLNELITLAEGLGNLKFRRDGDRLCNY
ncbi:unnamed protein product [Bathycoccus prasinos]